MKLSEAPSKIIGVQVGELALDLIRGGIPTLRVRLALLTEEGPFAFMDMNDMSGWSSKTMDAMRAFTESLEEDAASRIFKVDAQASETPKTETAEGPPQF